MIKLIMETIKLTLEEWKSLFIQYPETESVAISSISNWRQGKQQMRIRYIKIFIRILCETDELKAYEPIIRKKIVEFFKIRQYQRLYTDINEMSYEDFLIYVLMELKPEEIGKLENNWERVSIQTLTKLCVKKAESLYTKLQFQVQEECNKLLLTYKHEKNETYNVICSFLFGGLTRKTIESESLNLGETHNDINVLVRYLFVTEEVSDELYLDMLMKYRVYILKIDFYDIEAVKISEAYVMENYFGVDEATLRFMNILADVILHKISGMNLVVLKEILCHQFDYKRIDEHFFSSNCGIWNYHYPVRRALAFEEKIIKQKLRSAAKKGKNKLNILDIDLTGGLLGIRCSFGAGNVTCVDVSAESINVKQNIVSQYNEATVGAMYDGIDNVSFGYLRVDTMKLIGSEIPTGGYDIIIIGLGGGSYIADLDSFLRHVSGWLSGGKRGGEAGILLLSVFNRDALCFLGSQAKLDFEYIQGALRHMGDEWPLDARLYAYKEICHVTTKYYELLESYSYPTISSVVPDNYDDEIMEKLKEIDIDYACGDIESANSGLYNSLCLKKIYSEAVSQCYLDIKKYINEKGIVLQIIQHEEITSRAKMVRELSKQDVIAGDNFVKTVVLFDEESNFIIFYLLPLGKKFKKEYIENWYAQQKLKMVKWKLRFCMESELQAMGLATGSVSPFSFPVIEVDRRKLLFCDREIQYSHFQMLYTYSGDLKITYKIGKSSFLSYLKMNNTIFV